MKCPNCSFVNVDDAKQCKICGYDLPIVTSKREFNDEDDAELDSALKNLFGLKDSDEEDPLDVATVERMLHKKRPIQQNRQPETPSSASEQAPSTISKKARPEKTVENSDNDEEISRNSYRVIFIVLAILILLFIIFKSGIIKLPWKYDNEKDNVTTEATEMESSEETTEATTFESVNLGQAPAIEPLNLFFNYLPEFSNKGNLNITTLFVNSSDALSVLTEFAGIGKIEGIESISVTDSEINDSDATFTIDTVIRQNSNGTSQTNDVQWDFRVINQNNEWRLDGISYSASLSSGSVNASEPPSTTEPNGEQTTEPTQAQTTEATKPSTTETTTTSTTEYDYSGFKSSGTFNGGSLSSGQDVGGIRYGDHGDFERVAFDIMKWVDGTPTETVDVITSYTAALSADGKKITIVLTGARDAYASLNSVNFKDSPNISSVVFSFSGQGESVQIDITLKSSSQFKVFDLKSPARLVVDIAPM
ncbi:MAG: hypothetical protein BGO41_06020 [Clostridiales bacterium 38-18]|nr:MAG: hypothetical protein BGO41_06020 [Clostridiales bacterium 38-18]